MSNRNRISLDGLWHFQVDPSGQATIQEIDSWVGFIGAGIILSLIFFPVSWFVSVEAQTRGAAYRWLKGRLA